MRKVFLLKNLTYIFIILFLVFASGCKAAYNPNGWSVWGWSKTEANKETHVGFISTDFYFENADRGSQTTKEKIKIEKQLQDELGFGTIGVYQVKKF